MRPSIDDLTTFVTIVEAGGLSAAARRLGLAKSVVSKRLAGLERIAGAELVRRTTRSAQANDAGLAFYARAKRIIAELDAALEESGGADGPLRGPLRIATPLSFGQLFLVDPIISFARDHPQIDLTLDCDDRRVDIRGGGYDLAIRIGQLTDSALIAKRIAPAPGVLVASPAYLARRGFPARIEDLGEHECIGYANAPSAHVWSFEAKKRGQTARGVSVTPRLNVNNGEIIREAAIAGLGIAALPLFMIADALASGALKAVLPQERLAESAIYAVWPPGGIQSRKVRALIDLLAERVPALLAAAGALELKV